MKGTATVKAKSYHALSSLSLAVMLAAPAAYAGQELREEIHKEYPFDKSGKVSLENANGNVHIQTWDRDEVKVDAVKRGKNQEQLDAVKIEIDAKTDHIRIKTKYPDSKKQKSDSTSVDYTLTVPRQSNLAKINAVNGGIEIENVTGNVEANSVNGPVTASGLKGEVTLSSVNGPIKAGFAAINRAISLKSVNGGVIVTVPAEADADISASSVNGGVSTDFSLETKKHFPVGRNLEGKLGKGGPAIKLSSVNGAIRIDRSKTVALENQ